jgi:hypothetical protein
LLKNIALRNGTHRWEGENDPAEVILNENECQLAQKLAWLKL